jgi:RNA polymerase sigma-70 factor (ECF subfamily)
LNETAAAADAQDRAIVRRYLDGDQAAAGELVDRYQRPLYNVALRMLGNVQDAEDVTQVVFGNVFTSLETYDPRFRFFSWVYRMAVNESLNALKRRREMVTLDDHLAIPARGAAVDDAVEVEERVRVALLRLKEEDRSLLVLRHFSSLSYEEIAAVLDVPTRTVKSRLFTARDRLRTVLLAQGEA